jgi:hypothetical protein
VGVVCAGATLELAIALEDAANVYGPALEACAIDGACAEDEEPEVWMFDVALDGASEEEGESCIAVGELLTSAVVDGER